MKLTKEVYLFLRTIGVYAVLALLVYVLELLAPSGMCNPGLGVVSAIIAFPLITIFIFFHSLFNIIMGKEEYYVPLLTLVLFGLAFIVLVN